MTIKSSLCSPLSMQDTNVLKGFALILLLVHHLFYIDRGLYDSVYIADHNVVQIIGQWSKVCVAIFVFLSGYGLMYKTQQSGGIGALKRFYWHRFTKLFLNYWFIWLIFVPIGVFVFDRTFQDAYGNYLPIKLFLDFFGLINVFGKLGYNATWWFYSCIIFLYALFPLLYKYYNKDTLFTTLVVAVICFMPTPLFYSAKLYMGTFYMGMIYSDSCCTNTPPHSKSTKIMLLTIMVIASIDRLFTKESILFDTFLVLSMVLAYKNMHISNIVKDIFVFLGKHSMNIFLFHTFIFSHWFRDEIYASRNPLVIFISLLVSCVIISIFLEYLKRVIHFVDLMKRVEMLVK